MTQIPADWYPDPSPQNQGGSGMRYWDGNAWTEHVSPGTAPADPAYPAYPSYPPGPTTYVETGATTPDGQRLAGWWMRVLATVIDGLILIPVIALAATPVVASQWDNIRDWVDRQTANSQFTVNSNDSLPAAFDVSTGPGLALIASIFAATALYTLGFLAWKQATPGKLATGLRIRRRETPGLPFSTILLRWGFVGVLSALGSIPVAGTLFSIALILDYLWPLWDKNNQALHDKVAGTNVVKKA